MKINQDEFIKFLQTNEFEITGQNEAGDPTQLYKELKPKEDCFANEIYGLYVIFSHTTNVRFEFVYTAVQFDLNADGTIDSYIEDSYIGIYMGPLGTIDIMRTLYRMCFDAIINGVTEYKTYVLSMTESPEQLSTLQLISMSKEPITYLTSLYEMEYNAVPINSDIHKSLFDDDDFAEDDDSQQIYNEHDFDSSYDDDDIKQRMGF